MDRQGPPIRPRYQLTRGLTMFRQQKRCYDVMLSRQEGSMMRHLANAHSVTGPADIIYRTSFSGVWRDRSRRPVKQLSLLLDRVLTYKNLIYLLNLQFQFPRECLLKLKMQRVTAPQKKPLQRQVRSDIIRM